VFSLRLGRHHRNAVEMFSIKTKVARQAPLRLRRCMSSDQKIRGDSIASPAAPTADSMLIAKNPIRTVSA